MWKKCVNFKLRTTLRRLATYPPLALAAAWGTKDPGAPLCVAAFPSQLRWEDEFSGFPRLQARQMKRRGGWWEPHLSLGTTAEVWDSSSSCHLHAPLGGTVSTSQDALLSHYHQERPLSTRSLLLLNRCWALTRFFNQSTELELRKKRFFCFFVFLIGH